MKHGTACGVVRGRIKAGCSLAGIPKQTGWARSESNSPHLKIISLPPHSNVHILPADAARGQHCSPLLHVCNVHILPAEGGRGTTAPPLLHVSNLIPDLRVL